jgi:hypothetical protein
VGEPEHCIVKEMGCSREDFFRALPLALGGRDYERSEDRVVVREEGRRLEIAIVEHGMRRLGPTLRWPMIRVELRFRGYPEAQRIAFMTVFERYFMRAGG